MPDMNIRMKAVLTAILFLAAIPLQDRLMAQSVQDTGKEADSEIMGEPIIPGLRRPTIPQGFSRDTISIGPDVFRLADASNQFGFNLLDQIGDSDWGGNIFISPASAAMALAMVFNGARQDTETAMDSVLAFGDWSLDSINAANRKLSERMNSFEDVQLSIANSLWMSDHMEFKDEFLRRVQAAYAADIREVNLQDRETPTLINHWVAQKTNGRIQKIIEKIDDRLVMLLINAIYFKGTWTYQFDDKLTSDRQFTLLDGTSFRHPLMEQNHEFYYLETSDFQAISLPYGDGEMSMVVMLPSSSLGLDGLRKQLSPDNWQTWVKGLERREGTIVLPRFRLEYEKNLNDPLKEMGMAIAFNPVEADLTDMWYPIQPVNVGAAMANIQNLYIGKVMQKTFLEVNEEGTEAAAVTSVGIVATSAMHEERPPFRMVVDRPFFCAIVDKPTGLVLFMGFIMDPR
jgi:serine protease inhibitor